MINNFAKNGFIIAKSLIDEHFILDIVENLKKNFDNKLKSLGLNEPNEIYESMRLLHKCDIEAYKKTVGSLWRKMSVFNLTHHIKLQNYVKKNFNWTDIALPGGQVVHIQANCLKIPNGYFGVSAHQDFPSIQGSLDGLVIWIPLVDIDFNRFPLEVIPGSHKQGILPSIKNKITTWEIDPNYYKEDDFIPLECKVGDVVLMSYFTVHRTSKNGDDRLRIACSTRYDNPNEKSFIERGYPSAYIRTVNREQIHDIKFN